MLCIGERSSGRLGALALLTALSVCGAICAGGCSRTENGGPPVLAKKFPGAAAKATGPTGGAAGQATSK